MKIRRLELQGFKSFVDRTVLRFDHDLVAVVGPNGCGKSNTVDAIRWCMGEQSAGRLRGRAMEDVIFNGSDSRAPHSFAEVSLTFDNTDGLCPPEWAAYPELVVTRRLSRDGTSEYSINRNPVRLLDVTALFLGTGAGTRAYSIVEQGRVGLVVTSKPEDRRSFFEEAAGITRFKARRKIAERKIELTRQNLLRVADLLAELEKNLATLKRQAQKAERYRALRGEQRELELYLASQRYLELCAVGAATRSAHGARHAEAEGVEAALRRLEAEAEAVRAQLFEAESALERAQRDRFEADNDARRQEAELARVRDARAASARRAQDARRELHEVTQSARTLLNERDTLARDLDGVAVAEAEELERLAVAEARQKELREHLAAVDAELRAHREAALHAEKALASAEATRLAVARRLREAEERSARCRAEARAIDRRQAELAHEQEGLGGRVEALRAERDQLAARRTKLEASQEPLKAERERAEQRLAEARRERERAAARLHALREVARRHEGVGPGVRSLLDGSDPAVLGLLADRMEVPEDLARAVLSVLSDRWQDVGVASTRDALRLASKLRAERRGRGALVPDDALAAPLPPTLPHPPTPGVLGPLSSRLDLETAPPAWRGRLASVVLVDDLSSAVSAREALGDMGRTYTYVTLHGEVLEPEGRVVGGVPDPAGVGVMVTQAELRALEPRVEALTNLMEELSDGFEAAKQRGVALARDLEAARADLHAQELALVTLERDARAHEAELAQGRLRQVQLTQEAAGAEAQVQEATREDLALGRGIDEARQRREEARQGLQAGEAEAQQWKNEVDRAASRVSDARVVAARAKERATAARNAVHRLERSVEELSARGRRLDEELEALGRAEAEGSRREESLRASITTAVALASQREAEVTTRRRRYDDLKASLGDLEGRSKSVRARKDALQREVGALALRAREEALAMEHLVAGVAERHGVSLPRVVGDHHAKPLPTESDRQRLEELGRTLERLGEVNLLAIDEHAEQARRAAFFQAQKADIERALEQLEGAIQAMNKESRKRFKETFEDVDRHFQALFPRLFRGGQGRLQLTNPEDLLESGVEIVAQPPGKKLANLEAMSGGEKTLTAVTLLFALFMHRPSPFCVLDEVEAALDEANVLRFGELVRDLTDRSQFILITHNKRTMALVDVLYGVTMQEPGVSKLVGVKVRQDAREPPGASVA
ncbi:MAG: chromosome segregation protein SMC [Deltaproteobacteria bacterium]|nr:chromosome segregation protein SMC [Deltaproteobacteria bacterium]